MLLQFKVIGGLLMLLSFLHAFIPGYLDWKRDLRPLSLMNRQMMQTHTIFIAITVFSIGLLCFTSGDELMSTALGHRLCLGLSVFWLLRLVFQFFFYSAELWRGKRFETFIHILAVCFWVYLTTFFWLAA